jgi:subtilase family serine protease
MNLEKAKKKIFYSTLATFFLGILFASPAFATTPISRASGIQVLHAASVNSYAIPLDGPAPVGGVPFCHSGSLGTIICYTGSFLRTAYNFPPEGEGAPSTPGVPRALDGTGSTIVIVDAYGSPTITGDLPYYDGVVGIPAPPSFTVVCENGQPSPENSPCINWESPPHPECNPGSWVGETTLDVEMSHSLAPGAKIVLVEANSCYDSDLYAAEMAVVSNSTYAGSIMSQSFGEPDDLAACTTLNNAGTACIAWNYNLLDLPNSVFNLALLKGWTVLASSGDYGANEDICALSCANTQLDPAFPATSPDVLATGGTQGKAYGGQYGWVTPPEGTFTCAADTNCNTGLVWINGGTNGCTTASRPGLPTSCYPTHYGGEAAWNEFKTLGASTNIGYTTGGGVSTIYPRPTYQTNLPSYTKTLKGVTVHTVGRRR